MAHYETKNTAKKTPNCSTAEILYQARMGKHFTVKTYKVNATQCIFSQLKMCCWHQIQNACVFFEKL